MMKENRRYIYLLLTLIIYLVLTLPGWIREYSNFSSDSPFGQWAPVLTVILLLVWIAIHNLFLIDKLIPKGHYVTYSLALVIGLASTALLQQYVSKPFNFYWSLINIFIHTAICSALYMSITYIDQRRTFYKQALLSKEMELNQLKAQLNPHFLFNALNNIYSYNLENDKKGNDLILKLSQLMRYIVEVNSKKTVSLQEELQFISDYISLEKERLGYRCVVQLNIDCSKTNIQIEPLLFFPLVENAFKHSASTNDQSLVEISIVQFENELLINVTNSKSASSPKDSTQIGLNNVRRRLELLYPERHRLSLVIEDRQFQANLKLRYE